MKENGRYGKKINGSAKPDERERERERERGERERVSYVCELSMEGSGRNGNWSRYLRNIWSSDMSENSVGRGADSSTSKSQKRERACAQVELWRRTANVIVTLVVRCRRKRNETEGKKKVDEGHAWIRWQLIPWSQSSPSPRSSGVISSEAGDGTGKNKCVKVEQMRKCDIEQVKSLSSDKREREREEEGGEEETLKESRWERRGCVGDKDDSCRVRSDPGQGRSDCLWAKRSETTTVEKGLLTLLERKQTAFPGQKARFCLTFAIVNVGRNRANKLSTEVKVDRGRKRGEKADSEVSRSTSLNKQKEGSSEGAMKME
jgi:hypothetical protein